MSTSPPSALDRARTKAYWRLLPILFVCYIVAYVDRTNVGIAKLTMQKDLPELTEFVIGFGGGTCFFVGYFLLEIPGTLLVERWSARKWISRIMITWGIVAAATASVTTPFQFYAARFFLGLAEAGFFPGVIVYLTHWFPSRDRARALSIFLIATPIAQTISPKICNQMLSIGTDTIVDGVTIQMPKVLGLVGWQWIYIAWGIPAVVLGFVVLAFLTDRPGQAKWLADDEREALESELAREKAERRAKAGGHMTVAEALRNPKVLLLAAAYFFIVTGNYGVEMFLPSILKDWYNLNNDLLTWVLMPPPVGALCGQLFVGWNSDRTRERRFHASIPIYLGASALALTIFRGNPLWFVIILFTIAATGLKAYLPAFWTLPSLFLTEAAAAGSIGFINMFGNLGGAVGPSVLGYVKDTTGSFIPGIAFLSISMAISATIIISLGLGKQNKEKAPTLLNPLAEPVV